MSLSVRDFAGTIATVLGRDFAMSAGAVFTVMALAMVVCLVDVAALSPHGRTAHRRHLSRSPC